MTKKQEETIKKLEDEISILRSRIRKLSAPKPGDDDYREYMANEYGPFWDYEEPEPDEDGFYPGERRDAD